MNNPCPKCGHWIAYTDWFVQDHLECAHCGHNRVVERRPNVKIHKTAIVDDDAHIGDGTKIWHFVHVMPGAVIGQNCVIGQGCFIGNVKIGDGVKIQNNVSVYDGVTLEDHVFVGPSAVFTNVINPRSEIERKDEFKSTLVKRGATIGANATIICGVTIGEYALIGAGTVVTKHVPDYALVVGNPAQQLGWVCRCGHRTRSMLGECRHEKE